VAVALVDSSAIIAYLIEDDALHDSAVDAIESAMRAGTSLAMSAVTWSETLHGALLGYFPQAELREFVADFGIAILAVDAAVAEQAAALQKAYRNTTKKVPRPRLRTPDALILATSLIYPEIDTVVGGDEKWTKVPGLEASIRLLEEAP
jgi:predicted nucleic acid-binding protein